MSSLRYNEGGPLIDLRCGLPPVLIESNEMVVAWCHDAERDASNVHPRAESVWSYQKEVNAAQESSTLVLKCS